MVQNASREIATETLTGINRETYKGYDSAYVDQFLAEIGVSYGDEEQSNVDRLVAFDRSLYESLSDHEFWENWTAKFGYFSYRDTIDRLLLFNRNAYEVLLNEGNFDEIWADFVNREEEIGGWARMRTSLVADKLNRAEFGEIWSNVYNEIPLSNFVQPSGTDVVNRFVEFNRAAYEDVGERAVGWLLTLDPNWKRSAFFGVPDTEERVLVGIDTEYFLKTEPDRVFVMTGEPLDVECLGTAYCGDRFISWFPEAQVGILE